MPGWTNSKLYLITSDTHFSDKPRDSYRFGLFPWLLAQQAKYKPVAIFILGDLTEGKDRHSSQLVNKVIDGLTSLRPPVYILRGNHDCINADLPFFQFTNCIEGVHFISQPMRLLGRPIMNIFMIPHQSNQEAFDEACSQIPQGWGVMIHQTVAGAIAETGAPLAGLQWPVMRHKPRWVVSGDVHKPQQVGPVTYSGAPYQVRFGDQYLPRVLLMDDEGNKRDLHFPAPKKLSLQIRDAEEIVRNKIILTNGDQVKITIELTREEVVEWAKHKQQVLQACKDHGLEVYGVELKVASSVKRERIKPKAGKTNAEHFQSFCVAEAVPSQMKAAGVKLLTGE
jgi:DNA repair exonuclease SbcCD nuclease subunit